MTHKNHENPTAESLTKEVADAVKNDTDDNNISSDVFLDVSLRQNEDKSYTLFKHGKVAQCSQLEPRKREFFDQTNGNQKIETDAKTGEGLHKYYAPPCNSKCAHFFAEKQSGEYVVSCALSNGDAVYRLPKVIPFVPEKTFKDRTEIAMKKA